MDQEHAATSDPECEINVPATINVIKYRAFRTEESVRKEEAKGQITEYSCPHCHSKWSQYEVLEYESYNGFMCPRCDHLLTQQAMNNATKLAAFNTQFKVIFQLLELIETGEMRRGPPC